MTSEPTKVIEVFFSYAHKDERLRNELEKHLTILKRGGDITTWHDRKIVPGKEWEFEINKYLDKAHIILLLVSPDFMASDYCDSVEVKNALKRHDAGECRVIPIILRPVSWKDASFSKLQVLPTNGKPVTEWSNKDKAFLDIVEGIQKVVQEFSERSVTETSESTSPLLLQQAKLNTPQLSQTEINMELSVNPRETMGIYETTNSLNKILIEDEVESHLTSVGIRDNPTTLTVQQVRNAWENVAKRTRQKSRSGTMTAMLRLYKILDVEGTTEQPIVVIQSEKQAHYKYIKEEDRYKVLEWALTVEFGLECRVRLMPPGTIHIGNIPPMLSVQQIRSAWENVVKRTRQKSSSGTMAAMLRLYKILDVEGTTEQPVIVIQSEKQSHYKYVKEEDRYKILEWALTTEFGIPCLVRLVPPN